MILELLTGIKQSAQVALQLAKLMRSVAQYTPAEHDSAVVLLQVCEIAHWSDVATAHPHAAFDLDRNLQGWPRKVESPAAFGVEAVLKFGRRETELAGDG